MQVFKTTVLFMLLAISFVSGIQSINVSNARMFAQTSSQLNLTPELSQKFKNVASHTELAENLAQLAATKKDPAAPNPATPKPQQKAPAPKPKTLKEAADGTASAALKKKEKPTHLKKKGLAETGKLGVKANKNGSKVIKKKPALTRSTQKVNLFAPKVTRKKFPTPAETKKRNTDWMESNIRRSRRAEMGKVQRNKEKKSDHTSHKMSHKSRKNAVREAHIKAMHIEMKQDDMAPEQRKKEMKQHDMAPEQRKKEMKSKHGLHALTHQSRKTNKREAHIKKMHEEMKKH